MAKSKAYHNGEHSANPIVAEFDVIQTGLTKREHFSILAPDNIPQWFSHVFAEKNLDSKFTWHREGNGLQISECGFTPEGEQALYFAWRTHYADQLLKELSK